MSKITYYVSIERDFSEEEFDSGKHREYTLGEWESHFPESISQYWNGHGTAFRHKRTGFLKMKTKTWIESYDVGYSCDTKDEALFVLDALEPFIDCEDVNIRLSARLALTEEE